MRSIADLELQDHAELGYERGKSREQAIERLQADDAASTIKTLDKILSET